MSITLSPPPAGLCSQYAGVFAQRGLRQGLANSCHLCQATAPASPFLGRSHLATLFPLLF